MVDNLKAMPEAHTKEKQNVWIFPYIVYSPYNFYKIIDCRRILTIETGLRFNIHNKFLRCGHI